MRWLDALRRKWQPTAVFLPGESHGQRSLAGYSPWSRKESDTTEQLTYGCYGIQRARNGLEHDLTLNEGVKGKKLSFEYKVSEVGLVGAGPFPKQLPEPAVGPVGQVQTIPSPRHMCSSHC